MFKQCFNVHIRKYILVEIFTYLIKKVFIFPITAAHFIELKFLKFTEYRRNYLSNRLISLFNRLVGAKNNKSI